MWGPDNPGGHHEDPDVVALNQSVLSASGTSWRRAPDRLVWTDDLAARRDALLARWSAEQAWRVVKDPRLAITWPFWREALAGLPTVAIVRHPAAVLDSLATRGDDISEEDALRLWIASYRTVLSVPAASLPVVEFGPRAPAFFEQLRALLAAWQNRGFGDEARALDLERARAAAVREWMHHDDSGWQGRALPRPLIDEAEAMHDALVARALLGPAGRRSADGSGPKPIEWRAHIARAVERAATDDYRTAVDELELAAAAAPNPTPLRLRAVELTLQHGRAAEALARCDQALAEAPNRWWQLLRARCLIALDRLAEAVDCLDALIALPPTPVPAYRLRLVALARLERWSRMLEVSEPIAGDESPWVVQSWRAVALLRSGDRARALATFDEIGTIAPHAALETAQLLWAGALEAVGARADAEGVYEALLRKRDAPLPAYMGRVRLLRERGERSLALEVAEAACAAFPNDAWPRWDACALARELGNIAKSREHCERAAAIAPSHPETLRLQAAGP